MEVLQVCVMWWFQRINSPSLLCADFPELVSSQGRIRTLSRVTFSATSLVKGTCDGRRTVKRLRLSLQRPYYEQQNDITPVTWSCRICPCSCNCLVHAWSFCNIIWESGTQLQLLGGLPVILTAMCHAIAKFRFPGINSMHIMSFLPSQQGCINVSYSV